MNQQHTLGVSNERGKNATSTNPFLDKHFRLLRGSRRVTIPFLLDSSPPAGPHGRDGDIREIGLSSEAVDLS